MCASTPSLLRPQEGSAPPSPGGWEGTSPYPQLRRGFGTGSRLSRGTSSWPSGTSFVGTPRALAAAHGLGRPSKPEEGLPPP